MERAIKRAFAKLHEAGFDVREVAKHCATTETQLYALNYNTNEVPLKMLRELPVLRDARNALVCALAIALDARIPIEYTR